MSFGLLMHQTIQTPTTPTPTVNRKIKRDLPQRKDEGNKRRQRQPRKKRRNDAANETARNARPIVRDSRASRRHQWTKGGSGQSKKKEREREKPRKENEKKTEEKKRKEEKRPKTQEEWETAMAKALEKVSYKRMEKLFSLSFKWAMARGEGTARREVTKQFRLLSIRFHPDKHPEDVCGCYKVAFQALNAAHSDAKEWIP